MNPIDIKDRQRVTLFLAGLTLLVLIVGAATLANRYGLLPEAVANHLPTGGWALVIGLFLTVLVFPALLYRTLRDIWVIKTCRDAVPMDARMRLWRRKGPDSVEYMADIRLAWRPDPLKLQVDTPGWKIADILDQTIPVKLFADPKNGTPLAIEAAGGVLWVVPHFPLVKLTSSDFVKD